MFVQVIQGKTSNRASAGHRSQHVGAESCAGRDWLAWQYQRGHRRTDGPSRWFASIPKMTRAATATGLSKINGGRRQPSF